MTTMTVEEVTRKVVNKDPLFILDVRNESDFENWRIEGQQFDYLNVPYFELTNGVEAIVDKIPTDQDVLVVCAKGRSSLMVTEMLTEAGYPVYSLEGGMTAWSEYIQPVKVGELQNGGEIYQFVRIGKGCLSYMIISNGEAAVIDSARMTDLYLEFAEQMNAKITHVFDTHLHADHISGGRKLADKTNATYWIPPKDAIEITYDYQALEAGNDLAIGNATINIHALFSPGHTIGSTSFIVDERYLLSGDILFIDSIGRPDLAGLADDWAGDLRKSLYKIYKELSGELTVLPAHFTSVNELNEDGTVSEKLSTLYETNHGLNIADENEFKKLVTENLPPQPSAYQEIRQINMGKLMPEIMQQREMEIGPNNCAVR